MKNLTTLAALAAFALAAPSLHAAPEDGRLLDLDPKMNEKLKVGGTRLEVYGAADWIFDLGSDAQALQGWGLSTGIYVLPENPQPDAWYSRWGGSFHFFSTTGSEVIGAKKVNESIDAGYVVGEYGAYRKLGKSWEIGISGGLGVGAFFGESDDGTSVDSQGNWDFVLQIKPEVALSPTKNLRCFVAYKFAYMTPFYDTTLIGYRSVSFTQSALEAGISWRF